MICKKCGSEAVEQEGDRYVCKDCGAVAVKADSLENISPEEPEEKELFGAVMTLPDKYRIVIHLFYYEDYDIREIAEILHCREGTVKSQLSRGRKLLKEVLKEEWCDDE